MKLHFYPKVMSIIGAAAMISCTPPLATTTRPVAAVLRPDDSLSGQVYEAVNSYRRGRGAADLQRHPGLDRLAQGHCEYLRQNRGKFELYGKNVSHFGSEGRALVARERYRMFGSSENVAATAPNERNRVSALMSLWTNSKDHQKTLVNSWTHTGIGTVVDRDGTVFSTEIFGTISDTRMAARQRFSGF